MAEMSEKNKSILSNLRDKMDGGINRLLTTLAFVGCVNAMSAKTVTAAIMDVDGTKTYLLTNEGKMQVSSPSLVAAITAAHNQKGGDLVAILNFDERNSTVMGGAVYHSRIRLNDGISSALWDIRDIKDGASEMWGNIKDINISRIFDKGAEIISNYAPQPVQAGGTVRVVAENNQGQRGWAQYHTVTSTGRLKPEYDKTLSGNYRQTGNSYTSTNTGNYNNNYASTNTNHVAEVSINKLSQVYSKRKENVNSGNNITTNKRLLRTPYGDR